MSQESLGKPGRLFYLISAGALFIWGLCAYWFWGTGPALETESPLRIVVGAVMVFLMPGLTWGEVLGLRSRHFLVTIALATALSLAIGITLCPLTFLLYQGIRLWSALILVVSGTGLILAAVKASQGRRFTFLTPFAAQIDFRRRSEHLFALAFLLTLLIMSFGAYRWGEGLLDINREKLLHLQFTRFYYSLPHIFNDIGIIPGETPPNQVHFWEYLIAGWSALVNMDPLPVFYRCRFIFPGLGLSGMYLLVYAIFLKRRHVDILFTIIIVMVLGELMFLPPSALDWIKSEPTRGVMAFMGTVHHADSAMDLGLPLLMGVGLLGLRTQGMKLPIIFAGLLAAVFAWHPREFFQTAVYMAVLGLVLIFTVKNHVWLILRRWAGLLGIFFLVAGLFAALMIYNGRTAKDTGGYPEIAIKKTAAQYALQTENLLGVRSLFNFPMYFSLSSSNTPDTILSAEAMREKLNQLWPSILWMVLTALAIPFLCIFGTNRDRQLGLFTIFLWFFLLSWNTGMLLFLILTFSELHVTTPRNFYLLSYVVIAQGSFLAASFLMGRKGNLARLPLLLLLFFIGYLINSWWATRIPSYETVSRILGWAMFGSFLFVLFVRLFMKKPIKSSYRPSFAALAGSLLFLTPLLWTPLQKAVTNLFLESRPSVNWFGDDNPFHVSSGAIAAFQTLPPKQMVLVNPFEISPIFIYAPQYAIPSPVGTVMYFNEVNNEIFRGDHPIVKNPRVLRYSLPEFFHALQPVAQNQFKDWPGEEAVIGERISEFSPPLFARRETEQFKVVHMSNQEKTWIRLQPLADTKNLSKPYLAFDLAYEFGKNGLEPFSSSEYYVTFAIQCRISSNHFDQPLMFIEDWRADQTRDIFVTRVGGTEWKEYVLVKKIRAGANEVRAVLEWRAALEDWLEIESMALYVTDQHPFAMIIDHDKAVQRLKQDQIDYIFLQGPSSAAVRPYFKGHPENFVFILDHPEQWELLVRFRSPREK